MSREANSAPDSFFRNQALYGRHRLPTLVVLVTGILWALQPVAIYYSLEFEVRENLQNAVAMDTMIHFIIPAFLWVYFWLAFVLLVHFAGGRMRAGRLFKLTGLGMAPFALTALVRAAGKYHTYRGTTLPIGVTPGRFPSEWRGYNQLLAERVDDPLLAGAFIAGYVFLLLSGYIWTFVIKYSTNLEDSWKIYAIVALPIAVYIGYDIVPILL